MAQTYYEGGSPSNYTIGGVRVWFDRLLDDSTTPVRYEGYRDLGNVVESSFEEAIDLLEHFSSRSGTRTKDAELVTKVGEDLVVTLDELNVYNLRSYFMGGNVTDLAASSGGAMSISSEIMRLDGTEVRILGYGYNAVGIDVFDIAGSVALSSSTDYEIVDIIGGYKGIKRRTGGTITTGAYVKVDYDYDQRAHKLFYPVTSTTVKGKAMFFGVSDTGQEFAREFRNVQMKTEGNFSLKDADWTTFQLRLAILDDTETVPTAPFGLFRHYGRGTGL